MKRQLVHLLFILLLTGQNIAIGEENRRLVLVTDVSTNINALTAYETRRLFLGYPVIKDGHALNAAINQSDPLLHQVFLQKVVFMSSHAYERHLLANVIQLGGQRPQTFYDKLSLIRALKDHPGTVAALWDDDVSEDSNLVIIGELWRGTAQ